MALRRFIDYLDFKGYGCGACRPSPDCEGEIYSERSLHVVSEEVLVQRFTLQLCLKRVEKLPVKSSFLEVIFNKGSRLEERRESVTSTKAEWNHILQVTGVTLEAPPVVEVKIMDAGHVVPVHLGSAWLHFEDIIPEEVRFEELQIQLTPAVHMEAPVLSACWQIGTSALSFQRFAV